MGKKGLYFTFFILTGVVVATLVISFKYIKIPQSREVVKDLEKFDDVTVNSIVEDDLKNSWLVKIDQENSNNPYFYAINEITIELN